MSADVECVLYSLGQIEFGGKPIPATDELRNRLVELQERRKTYRQKLEDDLSVLNSPNTPVTLWSEYCQNQGLCNPADYTNSNAS